MIWLSEIILQQTRVDQGLPYYHRFVEKYPDVTSLANASLQDVLRLWQGLGYYSRARNMHRCAEIISEKHNGKLPETSAELIKLPGIGPYTAAAIASIAFDEQIPSVDGNVLRVISRLYGIEDDISLPETQKEIKKIALNLIPADNPGDFNQALMEFGALNCLPSRPACNDCPVNKNCDAFLQNTQHRIPVKRPSKKKRDRFFNYLVVTIRNKYILQKRKKKDIWHSLYEFPLIETKKPCPPDELHLPSCMTKKSFILKEISPEYKHVLSHQIIHAAFFTFEYLPDKKNESFPESGSLYSPEEIEALPRSILIDRYLREKII